MSEAETTSSDILIIGLKAVGVIVGIALFLFLTAVPVYYGGYWMAWDHDSTVTIEGQQYLWTDVVSQMTWWEWYTFKPMGLRVIIHIWIIATILGGVFGSGEKK